MTPQMWTTLIQKFDSVLQSLKTIASGGSASSPTNVVLPGGTNSINVVAASASGSTPANAKSLCFVIVNAGSLTLDGITYTGIASSKSVLSFPAELGKTILSKSYTSTGTVNIYYTT